MSDILYQSVCKINNGTCGTGFLINENMVITARHNIKNALQINQEIFLEFFVETNFLNNKVEAKVFSESLEFDIAILKLSVAATHISEWLELSSQLIEKKDEWETVGFPLNWSISEEGSNFCYLRDEVYNVVTVDSTIYDIDLSSGCLKDDWEYGLGGLSGSPIIIDGKIRAITLQEDESMVKSAIKAISINKLRPFFHENGIKTCSLLGDKNNLINERLDRQYKACNELFEKVNYKKYDSGINLHIDSYYINYDENGKSKMSDLGKYLFNMMVDYANSLEEIYKAKQDRMLEMNVFKKTAKVIAKIKEDKNLGALFLWTIAEGVLKAPKMFSRISYNDNVNDHIYSDVHINVNDSKKLVLNLGVGKLNMNLKSAVTEVMNIIKEMQNIQEDLFIIDDYIFEQMQPSLLKETIEDFKNCLTRDWENVVLEIIAFTGYDSTFINNLETRGFSQEEIQFYISKKFKEECQVNENFIFKTISAEGIFKDIKINWFIIPFNTVGNFEDEVLELLS